MRSERFFIELALITLLITLPAVAVSDMRSASYEDLAVIHGKLAYTDGGDIWKMDGDGTNRVRVIDAGTNDVEPVWSPDGTKIAFKSDRDIPPGRGLYVVNADGTGLTLLTNGGVNNSDSNPTWSPDGTKIAFASNRDNLIGSIYVMNADGSNVTRLTNQLPYSDASPAWSPDGTRIVFETNEGLGSNFAVINIDGTGRVVLGSGRYPAWSPDSTKIVFANLTATTGYQLFVMNAGGGSVSPLTSGNFIDEYPAFKSDAQKIAFTRNIAGQVKLWTMNADGTNQVNITTAIANAGQGFPDWQPDYSSTPVSVGGRVVTADGRGIANATVSLVAPNGSLVGNALTNPFGYFRFDAVAVQQTYVLTISSKRYSFANPSRSVPVNLDISGILFTALP